ncbi:hypothetical protein BDW02DRAFT_239987 [Decorospora gaudefroyi]|uniref:DUF300-domain-containing protein n=1 Tax=Decorospora gaudefroyi TaxID=184978 RepID=A0A6A5JVL7_9PLEO|nr:hypothetical protein BDW02DRAFT_239987 [Decorospora gaudefroyi]
MAPKKSRPGGGGGGGGGGGDGESCDFSSPEKAIVACHILFMMFMAAFGVTVYVLRKSGKRISDVSKSLLGLPFIGSVVCYSISTLIWIIFWIVLRCGGSADINWLVAPYLFQSLAYWLLLFVVVYQLNMVLLQQLGQGEVSKLLKFACLIAVGFIGVLTFIQIILESNAWARYDDRYGSDDRLETAFQFKAAWISLYFICVLAGGALALFTITTKNAAGGLVIHLALLFLWMILWVILEIVIAARKLDGAVLEDVGVLWMQRIAQALTYVFVLCIARHTAWSQSTEVNPMVQQGTAPGFIPSQQQGVPQQQYGMPQQASVPQQQYGIPQQAGVPQQQYGMPQEHSHNDPSKGQAYVQEQGLPTAHHEAAGTPIPPTSLPEAVGTPVKA